MEALYPYGKRTFYSPQAGGLVRASRDHLPGADDPNDIQSNPLFNSNPLYGSAGLGEGVDLALPFLIASREAPESTEQADKFPSFRYGLQLRPGIFYDTGFIPGTPTAFLPTKIALDGYQEARNRGQISFRGFTDDLRDVLALFPARLQFDSQTSQLLGAGPAQAYVDAMFVDGQTLEARTVAVRVFDQGEQNGLLIGKSATAFGDIGSAPMLISTGALPIGSVGAVADPVSSSYTGVPQLRFSRYLADNRMEMTVSIEDQSGLLGADVLNPAASHAVRLNRWPISVARLRLLGANNFNSYQVAALVRPIVFNDVNFQDHTVTGWGVSGVARFCDAAERNAFYVGAAAGEGLGNYIFGGTLAAAIPNETTIRLLSNFGAYAAYQRVWNAPDPGHNLSSNIAYGCVLGDAATPDSNRRLHQAWCNLLWNVTASTAFGLEYQYGRREVGDGTRGDDHRIMFVCQIALPGGKTKESAAKSANDAASRTLARDMQERGAVEPAAAPSLSQRRF